MSGLNQGLQLLIKVDSWPSHPRSAAMAAPLLAGLCTCLLITACAPARIPAPVEIRNVGKSSAAQRNTASAPPVSVSAPLVPASPAPDGFYRIKRGDTLIGISLDHGIAWRDLASWNSIDNPNLIEVDQLLRIRSPGVTKTDIKSIAPSAPSGQQASAQATPPVQTAVTSPQQNASVATNTAAENVLFAWPGKGQVIAQFADPGQKGIAISGNEGDPVSAAADGRIVYSGNGLRGYGNLVIIKHDGDFLTAYAHNKSILVNEGQTVKRGQKIAELGKTDSDIPKLHFEVRKSGKPVDPLKYLATR